MDKFTKEKRSEIMSKIKGKFTSPEKAVIRELKRKGYKFKHHSKALGSPDIAFPARRLAIFIDGDFWHGWDFLKRKGKLPDYWVKKIRRNINRDRRYRKRLVEEGWKVVRLWEHQILNDLEGAIAKVERAMGLISNRPNEIRKKQLRK